MSKSLGNGIDPIEIIDQYGADAMRFSLMLLTAEGQDVKLSPTRFEMGRNFTNKLWNAARFALMNLDDLADLSPVASSELEFEDRWLLSRLSRTVDELTRDLEGFHFNAAAHLLYDFAWHSLCDWYLEAIKPRLYGSRPSSRRVAQKVLAVALDALLRMLHPFVPFITEAVWRHLCRSVPDRGLFAGRECSGPICLAEWPRADWFPRDERADIQMPIVADTIRAVRNIRSSLSLGERTEVDLLCASEASLQLDALRENEHLIKELAKVRNLYVFDRSLGFTKPHPAAAEVVGPLELYVPLEGLIDLDEERRRLEARIQKARKALAAVELKLGNQSFLSKAPEAIVNRERERRQAMLDEVEKLDAGLRDLAG
jgi:valyl-tRNA synthetase